MSDIVAASGRNLQPSFPLFITFSTIFFSLRKNAVEITVTKMFIPSFNGIN